MEYTFKLPYPPTINNYYHYRGARRFVSVRGISYRKNVYASLIEQHILSQRKFQPLTVKMGMDVEIFKPDRRRRDTDNITKALLDAVQSARFYEDDSQIDQLILTRNKEIIKGGQLEVQCYTPRMKSRQKIAAKLKELKEADTINIEAIQVLEWVLGK